MVLIKHCVLPLCLLAPLASSASVIYSFEADCVRRSFFDFSPGGAVQLGCPDKIRGQILLPDDYVPGTTRTYEADPSEPQIAARFTLYDAFRPVNALPLVDAADILLPVQSGPGYVHTISRIAYSARIELDGLFNWAVDAGTELFSVAGTNTTFSLVPEPGSMALAAVALAALGVTSRRSAKALPA